MVNIVCHINLIYKNVFIFINIGTVGRIIFKWIIFFFISEYTLVYQTLVDNALSSLSNAHETYLNNFNTAPSLVASISSAAHFASVFLLYAKATSHTSPNIEHAESKWFFMCVCVSVCQAGSVCLSHCLSWISSSTPLLIPKSTGVQVYILNAEVTVINLIT